MLTFFKILAGAWFVLLSAGGAAPARASEDDESGQRGWTDWIGKILAIIGAVYLFRDVYQDIESLVGDEERTAPSDALVGESGPPPSPAPRADEETAFEGLGGSGAGEVGSSETGAGGLGGAFGGLGEDGGATTGGATEQLARERGVDGGLTETLVEPPSQLVELVGALASAPYPAWSFALALAGFSGYLAFRRGVSRELAALLTWVVALVAAIYAAPRAALALVEADFSLGLEPALVAFAAFLVIFVATLVVLSLIIRLALRAPAARRAAPSRGDHILGFVYGAARGVVIAAVIAVVLARSGWGWPALSELTAFVEVEWGVGEAIALLAERSDVMSLVSRADGE